MAAYSKTEHRLVVEFMVEDALAAYTDNRDDLRHLSREVDSVLGEGACERMAAHAVRTRMTPIEIVQWAACDWQSCRAIATGDPECGDAVCEMMDHYRGVSP
jgi:hypothetical protein